MGVRQELGSDSIAIAAVPAVGWETVTLQWLFSVGTNRL